MKRILMPFFCMCLALPALAQDSALTVDRLALLRAEALDRRGAAQAKAAAEALARHERAVDFALRPETDADFNQERRADAARLRVACQSSDNAACLDLAKMYHTGDGVWVDQRLAMHFYFAVCDRGYLDACTAVANALSERSDWVEYLGLEDEKTGAGDFQIHLSQGCADGVAGACEALANVHAYGMGGVLEDAELSKALKTLACGLDDAYCPTPRPVFDHESVAEECASGKGKACNRLANAYHYGWDVERSPERAFQLYRQACEQGLQDTCLRVAQIYFDGTGTDQDRSKAAEFFVQGCELAEVACEYLAGKITDGARSIPDMRYVLKSYEVACVYPTEDLFAFCDVTGLRVKEPPDPLSEDLDETVAPALLPALRDARTRCLKEDAAGCFEMGQVLPHAQGNWLLNRACDLGDARACTLVAFNHVRSKQRLQLLEQACAASYAMGCLRYVQTVEEIEPGTRLSFLEDRCDRGNSGACTVLGEILLWPDQYRRDFGNPSDFGDVNRAVSLLREACDAADGQACSRLAWAFDPGRSNSGIDDTEANRQRYWELLTRGCDLQHGQACTFMVFDLLDETGARYDPQSALESAVRGCVYGRDCTWLSRATVMLERDALRREHGVLASAKLGRFEEFREFARGAARRANRGCVQSDIEACVDLGGYYLDSDLVEHDMSDESWARALFLHACESGSSRGCARYADRFRYSTWDDEHIALDYAARACDLGHALSCAEAGNILSYDDLPTVTQDFDRAAEFYERGCLKGQTWSCEQLGRLDHPDPAQDREYEITACVHGDALGCYFLGKHEFSRPRALANQLFKIGCEDGEPDACRAYRSWP